MADADEQTERNQPTNVQADADARAHADAAPTQANSEGSSIGYGATTGPGMDATIISAPPGTLRTTNAAANLTRQFGLTQIQALEEQLRQTAQSKAKEDKANDEQQRDHHHLSLSFTFLVSAQWSFVMHLKKLQRERRSDIELVRAMRRLFAVIPECHFLTSISIDWRVLHFLHMLDATVKLEKDMFRSLARLPNLLDLEIVGKRVNTNTHVTWPAALQPLHDAPKLERLRIDERGCLSVKTLAAWQCFADCIRRCTHLKDLYIGNLQLTLQSPHDPQHKPFDGFFRDNPMSQLEHLCIKRNTTALSSRLQSSLIGVDAFRDFLASHTKLRQLTLRNVGLDDDHCRALVDCCLTTKLCQLNLRDNRNITHVGCRHLVRLAETNRSLLDLEVDPVLGNSTALASLSIHMSMNRAQYDQIHHDSTLHQWMDYLHRLQSQRPRQFVDIEYDIPLASTYLSFRENPQLFEQCRRCNGM